MVPLVAGKAIPVQAWKGQDRPLRLQEVGASRISRQLAHVGGNIVSPMHWLPLPPRIDSWCSFLLEPGRIRSLKIPMTPLGMEPTTFGIIVQCLNQLHHHVLPVLLVAQIIQPAKFVFLEKCFFMFHLISVLTTTKQETVCLRSSFV